jgi:hypothetical protein
MSTSATRKTVWGDARWRGQLKPIAPLRTNKLFQRWCYTSKADEIEQWQNRAIGYRNLAAEAGSEATRFMLRRSGPGGRAFSRRNY